MLLEDSAGQVLRRATSYLLPLAVRGLPYQCWNCGLGDFAVALIHVGDGLDTFDDMVTTARGVPLAYAAALLAADDHPQSDTVRVRPSRTIGQRYLSNGCTRCDALFGEFFVQEEIGKVFAAGEPERLPELWTGQRPAIEWYTLRGLTGLERFS